MKSSDDDKSSAAPTATEPTSTEVPIGESAVSSPPIPSGVERKKDTSETSVDAGRLAHFDVAIENEKKCDETTNVHIATRTYAATNAKLVSLSSDVISATMGKEEHEKITAPTAEMMPSSLGHEEYKSGANNFADNNGKPREWGFSISAILMILTVLIGSIAYFVIRCIYIFSNPRMMYSYTHTIIYSSIIFLTFKSLSTAHLSRPKPRM